MRDGVVHIVGILDNRHDPIRLGIITDDEPMVRFLTEAQNVDIDDNFRATTRDGRTLRYAGTPHSLFVHPESLRQCRREPGVAAAHWKGSYIGSGLVSSRKRVE